MFEVIPIPAFRDNYIWLLHRHGHAALVDPGDAAPALAVLYAKRLRLDAILITHHHDDHVGGVAGLLEKYPATVYAPRKGQYDFHHTPVGEGDVVTLTNLNLELRVMETPGHTLDHVVYFGAGTLFCGDTLFSCGCGRMFEGSCEQFHHALQRLAALPGATNVYCAHEYTRHNIDFACRLDADNPDLVRRKDEVERLLGLGLPSLPSTIATELATNPFLRCDTPAIRAATMNQAEIVATDPVSVFCTIRKLRNTF
jgi:hydroxyacylglutathione hydrolase